MVVMQRLVVAMFLAVCVAASAVANAARAEDAKPADRGAPAAGQPAATEDAADQPETGWDKDPPALDLEMSPEEWKKQLRAWRAELEEVRRQRDKAESFAKATAIMDKIRAVKDPKAVHALIALVEADKDGGVRVCYVQALWRTGSKKAVAPLAKRAVFDDPTVRREAAKGLSRLPDGRDAIPILVRYLATKSSALAAKALRVAGFVQPLGPSESPDPRLTRALINALIIDGKTRVPVTYWYAYDQRVATGHGWHRRAGGKTWTGHADIDIAVPNPEALEALKEYSGKNYEYDVRAWQNWYAARQKAAPKQP